MKPNTQSQIDQLTKPDWLITSLHNHLSEVPKTEKANLEYWLKEHSKSRHIIFAAKL